MVLIVLYIFGYLCEQYVLSALLSECVTPPLECPNENITFWLYTKQNEHEPHELSVNDSKSLTGAPWVKGAPIKILIHGYTGHKNFSPNTEIRPAYMATYNYNIISVDYNPIAREPCYFEAAENTELVGMCTAQLIDELVKVHHFSLEQFHIIGFSLGGQTAGFIGDYVTCGRLPRITALDPAMPLFVTTDDAKKVDRGDALFVDVLHTNALEKGKLEASGHADFYANGGVVQPGCKSTKEKTMSSCNHDRAPIYFAESIGTDIGFYATKCYSWVIYMIGWCEMLDSKDDVQFGEHVSKDAKGLYFFSTNAESPYARGPKNNQRKRSIPFPWIK